MSDENSKHGSSNLLLLLTLVIFLLLVVFFGLLVEHIRDASAQLGKTENQKYVKHESKEFLI